jgi:nitrous oxidase accessory protein
MAKFITNQIATSAPSREAPAARTWKLEWDRLVAAGVAAVLLALALGAPLWTMTLLAPQYPGGLHMTAYGDRFEGAVREINILNHYIGMKPIEQDEVLELKLFRPAMLLTIAAVLVLAVLPLTHRLKVAQGVAIWLLPLGFIADLQWWLYRYGHSMDPLAPLRLEPFTPRVYGTTKVMNFHNEADFAIGFWLLVGAAFAVSVGPTLLRAIWELPRTFAMATGTATVLMVAVLLSGGGTAAAATDPPRIADMIAAAEPGGTITVPPGLYREQLVIEKPVRLVGKGATIDGGGAGDVVVVKADDVELRGFTIRNGGRAFSQEHSGVRLLGHGTLLASNTIEDVFFGVHIIGGGHHQIEFNTIRPDESVDPEWRGHGISMWNSEGNVIRRNTIRDAKDGLFISFSHHNFVHGNTVTKNRFGLHYMSAEDNRFTENVIDDNMAGALVMNSKRLFLKDNQISNNRRGNTAMGLLLKSVDDLWAQDNRITGNGTGILMEDAPQSPGASVTLTRNLIALNRVGLGLMTTTAATFYENSFVDNGVQVSGRGSSLTLAGHGGSAPAPAPSQTAQPAAPAAQPAAQGSHGGHGAHGGATPAVTRSTPATAAPAAGASAKNVWSAEGRGNYWSDYAGYDADGDGVGDRPYRPTSTFGALIKKHAGLDLFRYTPAQQALDAAGRLFPVVRPEVLIEDQAPLMAAPTPLPAAGDARGLMTVTALMALLAAVPLLWARGGLRALTDRFAKGGMHGDRDSRTDKALRRGARA